ncbi:MAG: ABC transporter substrate-binding protein [Cyanobacteria bacterium P01_D01_bin.44]
MKLSRRQLLQFSSYWGLGLLTDSFLLRPRLVQAELLSETPLTMQLDWKFNVQFAGLLMAEGAGLYADREVVVELLPWESGIVVPEVVAANPGTIGCAEQNLILEAQAAGAPIKVLATMLQSSPLGLMTLPDAGITTLEDLVSLKVGMHVDGLAVMELVQGVSGFDPGAIEVVEIPYEDKYDRLLSGELAAIQCYAVDEPIGFKSQYGIEPIMLKLADYGYEAYAQVIFAHNDLIESSPEEVSGFLQATFGGWSMALADIPSAAAEVVANYVEPGSKYEDVTYQTQSLELIAEYMLLGIEPAALGTIDSDRWMRMAQRFVEYGIIDTAPEQADSLATRFWPAG